MTMEGSKGYDTPAQTVAGSEKPSSALEKEDDGAALAVEEKKVVSEVTSVEEKKEAPKPPTGEVGAGELQGDAPAGVVDAPGDKTGKGGNSKAAEGRVSRVASAHVKPGDVSATDSNSTSADAESAATELKRREEEEANVKATDVQAEKAPQMEEAESRIRAVTEAADAGLKRRKEEERVKAAALGAETAHIGTDCPRLELRGHGVRSSAHSGDRGASFEMNEQKLEMHHAISGSEFAASAEVTETERHAAAERPAAQEEGGGGQKDAAGAPGKNTPEGKGEVGIAVGNASGGSVDAGEEEEEAYGDEEFAGEGEECGLVGDGKGHDGEEIQKDGSVKVGGLPEGGEYEGEAFEEDDAQDQAWSGGKSASFDVRFDKHGAGDGRAGTAFSHVQHPRPRAWTSGGEEGKGTSPYRLRLSKTGLPGRAAIKGAPARAGAGHGDGSQTERGAGQGGGGEARGEGAQTERRAKKGGERGEWAVTSGAAGGKSGRPATEGGQRRGKWLGARMESAGAALEKIANQVRGEHPRRAHVQFVRRSAQTCRTHGVVGNQEADAV